MKSRRCSRFIAALITAILFSALPGCDRGIRSIPQQLLGFWTTDAPAYQDRYIKFEEKYVLFGLGGDELPTIQRIVDVVAETSGLQTTYTLRSRDKEGAHELVVVYDPYGGGTLQIRNQRQVVWRRASLD